MGEDHDFVMRARKKGMELVLLREPLLTMSLRRFRAQGVLPVLHQSTQSMFHILLKGPITSEFFEYPMGGHVHKRKLKTQKSPARIATQSVAGGKLKNYFKSIDQIQKKFVNLLQE
jgi:hypothetical protein